MIVTFRVDIATEWNLKPSVPNADYFFAYRRYSNRMEFKERTKGILCLRKCVDIATEWNLKSYLRTVLSRSQL